MRGYRKPGPAASPAPARPGADATHPGELVAALRTLTDELRATREALEANSSTRP